MKKRKSPTEILEKVPLPKYEHSWIKDARGKPKLISRPKRGNEHFVYPTYLRNKVARLMHPTRNLMRIHTHTDTENPYRTNRCFPSGPDVFMFLCDNRAKTDVIAQQDKNGKVFGYTFIRKTSKTPRPVYDDPTNDLEFMDGLKNIADCYSSFEVPYDARSCFRDFSSKYHLRLRFVPAKGYSLNKSGYFEEIKEHKRQKKIADSYEKTA